MSNQLEHLDALLKSKQAEYTILKDQASIQTAADGAKLYGLSLHETTPTLILKSKDQYFAAIICGNTRISFKKLKQALGVKEISMADPETILRLTGAKIGDVGLINEGITTLMDAHVLKNQHCFGGCGVPLATLRIKTVDLVSITQAKILDFTDPRAE